MPLFLIMSKRKQQLLNSITRFMFLARSNRKITSGVICEFPIADRH